MSSSDNTSQVFHDLQWAVQSPSLLREAVPATLLADFDPKELEASFKKNQHRQVGRYFEALVEFWLTKIRNVEMIERGLQVQNENRTLGELDFVFRDEAGILTHWETAVKFYLHHEGEFIGPNAADTLDRKVRHLKEHQIQLGQKAIPEIEKSEVWMKGRLYYHPDDGESVKKPEYVTNEHLRGSWIRANELDRLDASQSYHILEKPHWFTMPVFEINLSGTRILDFLRKRFQVSDKPIHILDSEGKNIFLVSNQWPFKEYQG